MRHRGRSTARPVAVNVSPARSERVSLPGDPKSAGMARQFLRRMLLAWQVDALETTASLVLNELITNAVLHAGTRIDVRVSFGARTLRLEVGDGSTRQPRLRHFDLDATTGRGLALVAALSRAWGVAPAPDGKVVWCELAYDGAMPATTSADGAADRPVGQGQLMTAGAGTADPGALHDDEGVEIRLIGFPVSVYRRAQQHNEELLRELQLLGQRPNDHPTTADEVPVRFLRLMSELRASYRAEIADAETRIDTAVAAGRDRIDEVVFRVSHSAGDAARRLGRLLDDADRYCAAGHYLVTLSTPPELRLFRRWYLGEFVRQTAGNTPTPWNEHRS